MYTITHELSSTNIHDLVLDKKYKLIIMVNMSERKTMTLKLTEEQLVNIRQVAAQFGFIAKRGPLHGTGSVQQMIEAVADKRYTMFLAPRNGRSIDTSASND